MNFTIRKAKKEDAKSILELIQHLADFEKEPEAVVLTVQEIKQDGFGQQPLFQTLIAEVDKKVVGMALYYYRYSTWKGKTIHLEDLIVFESYRKQNIGRALYDRVLQQAYKEKVRRVEWNVLDWNTPARDFYINTGAQILKGWEVVQMDEERLVTYINNSKR